MDAETFAFGPFRLIPNQRILFEDGKPLRLGSRALDILVTLVESAGETIRNDQLIARTGPETVVAENTLRVHVAALRKALGDGRVGKRYIVNNPGRGYTFVAPVAREHQQPATTPTNGAAVGGNLPARPRGLIRRLGSIDRYRQSRTAGTATRRSLICKETPPAPVPRGNHRSRG
ncbi:MAG TPA: transcriptional regulator [Stellaceae bacterium]|nr:transcriptional regulator [Stellaceae bacterium]